MWTSELTSVKKFRAACSRPEQVFLFRKLDSRTEALTLATAIEDRRSLWVEGRERSFVVEISKTTGGRIGVRTVSLGSNKKKNQARKGSFR